MYDIRKWIIKNVSCATHAMILPMISYVIQQKSYVFDHDIINFWYYSWYHGRFRTITPMISVTYDITALWYHNFHDILAHTAWYHGTCATGWRWLGAPRASRSAFPGLAIANVLGTGVQLNGDRLDPPHGLVAVAAAWIVSGCRLVVVKKSRLAASDCAAHAGKAPIHSARWHWSVKYGLRLRVLVGFKLWTGEKVKEEDGEGGPADC